MNALKRENKDRGSKRARGRENKKLLKCHEKIHVLSSMTEEMNE